MQPVAGKDVAGSPSTMSVAQPTIENRHGPRVFRLASAYVSRVGRRRAWRQAGMEVSSNNNFRTVTAAPPSSRQPRGQQGVGAATCLGGGASGHNDAVGTLILAEGVVARLTQWARYELHRVSSGGQHRGSIAGSSTACGSQAS